MFFGKIEVQEEIISHAKQLAKEQGFIIIYGSTMGGISRGLQSYDSDYDLRFLFIKPDYPNKIYYPNDHMEEELIYRYLTKEDNTQDTEYVYDKIAFWEITSFFQYYLTPSIDGKANDEDKLYYIVEHTFRSPYTWDPYGIQVKMLPFINKLLDKKRLLKYYLNVVDKYENNQELIISYNYVIIVWACLSISWVIEYNEFAPCYIHVLFSNIESESLRCEINQLLDEHYSGRKTYSEVSKEKWRGSSRNAVFSKRRKHIDLFILDMKEKGEVAKENSELEVAPDRMIKEKAVSDIYYVLKKSMEEAIVVDIN